MPLVLPLAYGLDLVLGDPRWLPHPVRAIGWVIKRLENIVRRFLRNELFAGALLLILVGGGVLLSVVLLLSLAARVSPFLRVAVEVALLFFCLSTKDLMEESLPVERALRAGNIREARRKVAMIVGRDTEHLTETEIVRGAVETIAESTMDGIVAPLFFWVVAGVPGACLYKAVNTLDSMVGFRSSRYIRFGKVPARFDAWINVLPAWITAFLFALSSLILGLSAGRVFPAILREPSVRRENSWVTEAAMAGALDIQLGGTHSYQGATFTTPLLGERGKPLSAAMIPLSLRVMFVSSLLAFASALGAAIWLS